MAAEKHPSYKEELERCNYTLGYVERSLESTIKRKEKLDNDIDNVSKHFTSENSQSFIDMMINTTIRDSLALRLRNLFVARSKPYFARIDFSEKDSNKKENLYIGKMSLMRDEDQEVIIVDWRAPIANLYYEGRIGEADYWCPGGNIKGELTLKRQFAINEGVLQEIFDIDITTNDEFLQTYLGANSDNRLKEIVSTIQVEQNRIIRADMWKPLIVQGAAGSGKTTIALHRIAYLVYTFEKTFEPENFMIIAPNKLFLNYISEVLPELGVERVKQTTFEEFAMELIGKKFKLKDPFEKLTKFVNHNATKEEIEANNILKNCSQFKASMLFREVMDEYVKYIESSFIPKEHFKIANMVVFKYAEINDLFLKQYKNWPIVQRIDEIKKYLSNRLKQKKDIIIYNLNEQCDNEIMHLKTTMEESPERQKLIIAAIEKRDAVIGKIESYAKSAVKEYIKKISKFSPYEYYCDLINNEELFNKLLEGNSDKDLIDYTRNHTRDTLKSGYLEIEDIAPIIYLKYLIHGMDEKIPVKHIVIDEGQDFSAFQFYVLKKIVKDSSFTILGDLCQSIHSYRGIRTWQDVVGDVFEGQKCGFFTLEESYRTTVEIMSAANTVIDKIKDLGLVLAKPVIRHGDKVEVIEKQNLNQIAEDISTRINQYRKENFKTAAIVLKTVEECQKMYKLLKGKIDDLNVITGKEEEYKNSTLIVPSYLTKGLEFDVVMIADAGIDVYKEDELDIKLLYVSMTRALHKLCIYYHGEKSLLLDKI